MSRESRINNLISIDWKNTLDATKQASIWWSSVKAWPKDGNFCPDVLLFFRRENVRIFNKNIWTWFCRDYYIEYCIFRGHRKRPVASISINFVNPLNTTGIFPHPLKLSRHQRFSDVFRGYRKRLVAWNDIIVSCFNSQMKLREAV